MKTCLCLFFFSQVLACSQGGWSEEEVQAATSKCTTELASIPCPSTTSDIDGDGIADSNCGLGSSAESACECLVQETEAMVSEVDFERMMDLSSPSNCEAAEVFIGATESCLENIACPSPDSDINGDGTPDTNCGLTWSTDWNCDL